MGKSKKRKRKSNAENYPSAIQIKEDCYNEYSRMLSTYEKVYDKVNIMLTFCGVILLVILKSVNFSIMAKLNTTKSPQDFCLYLIYTIATICSAGCILFAVTSFLKLLKSRKISIFDSWEIREEKIYELVPNDAALWMIQQYTDKSYELKDIIDEKQLLFDSAVKRTIYALLLHALAILVKKGI